MNWAPMAPGLPLPVLRVKLYVWAYRDPKSIIDRHRPIAEAIIDGDAERARDCARKHVQICKSSLEAYVSRGRHKNDAK